MSDRNVEQANLRWPVVLFDMDGTLTDSAPGIIDGIMWAVDQVGYPPISEEQLSTMIGPPLIDSLTNTLHMPGDLAQATLSVYFRRYSERGWAMNEVFPGIIELLQRLRAAGARLGVATSKSEHFALKILAEFGLAEFFEAVGTASADGSRKTKSDSIRHALAEMGVPTHSADAGGTDGVVLVGDRRHDIDGAAEWGIPTILVDWGYGTSDERAQAFAHVGSPDELATLLGLRGQVE